MNEATQKELKSIIEEYRYKRPKSYVRDEKSRSKKQKDSIFEKFLEQRKSLEKFLQLWQAKCCNSRKDKSRFDNDYCEDCILKEGCVSAHDWLINALDRLEIYNRTKR